MSVVNLLLCFVVSQLCFAEELANCSLQKLANNHCDPGCDSEYCIAYDEKNIMKRDLEFSVETMLTETVNDTIYAADAFKCPWNGTSSFTNLSDEYPFCSDSSAESIFIDPNVPSDTYDLCDSEWIGDMLCGMACLFKLHLLFTSWFSV